MEVFWVYVKVVEWVIEVLGMWEVCEGFDECRSARDETSRDAVWWVVEEWKDVLFGVYGWDVDEYLDCIEDVWMCKVVDCYYRLCEVEEWDESSRALVKKAFEFLRVEFCGKVMMLMMV